MRSARTEATARAVAGIPTIGFGPSREDQAHVIDEYVEVEQLVSAARGFAAIVREMLGAG